MKHDDEMKEEVVNEEEEMEMDAEEADMDMADAAPEGGEDLGDADEPEMGMDKRKSLKSLSKQLVLFLV